MNVISIVEKLSVFLWKYFISAAKDFHFHCFSATQIICQTNIAHWLFLSHFRLNVTKNVIFLRQLGQY